MIKLENMCKEFKVYKKKSGFTGAIQNLFSNEYTIKKAVSNMTFSINEGEVVGYIGSNGAGKSTTIKMMSGILVPTSGTCTVNGIIPYENRQINAMNIGVVFGQRTQLWWDLPLSDTFEILKEMYNVNDSDYKRSFDFLAEVLDVHSFISNTVRTLSLGQRMRADLMAALMHNPRVLYLDEPTIGLDVVVKDKLRNAIKYINNTYKTTIVLTTHDMIDIEELCNRIIIIDSGLKIYDGTLSEMKSQYGYMNTITMIFKDKLSDFNINNYNLNVDDLSFEVTDSVLKIKYNKNKISSADIVTRIFSKSEIKDFEVQETSVSEIVKMIYSTK